jgi:hypothetical protein
LKTKPDLTSLSPSKPDLSALTSPSPSPSTEMTENESRSRGGLCEFCGQKRATMWTQGSVPPGKHISEGHEGALFGMCQKCADARRYHPEWTWTPEREERGY